MFITKCSAKRILLGNAKFLLEEKKFWIPQHLMRDYLDYNSKCSMLSIPFLLVVALSDLPSAQTIPFPDSRSCFEEGRIVSLPSTDSLIPLCLQFLLNHEVVKNLLHQWKLTTLIIEVGWWEESNITFSFITTKTTSCRGKQLWILNTVTFNS